MKNPLTAVVASAIAASMLGITVPAGAALAQPQAAATASSAVTAGDLAQTGADQQRWLSIPGSRIVMNPFNDDAGGSEIDQNSGPQLPLNTGYYVNDKAPTTSGLLQAYRRTGDGGSGSDATAGFSDDFSDVSAWSKASNGATMSAVDAGGAVTLPGSSYGYVARKITVDVSANPILTIDVASTKGLWAVKLNTNDDGNGDDAFELQHDSTATGKQDYNLASTTGWTGTKTFWLKLYQIGNGDSNTTTTYKSLSMHPGSVPVQASTSASTTWRPDRLEFTARYAKGTVTGDDQFHDVNSITRRITADGVDADGGKLVIAGAWNGTPSYDEATRVLTITAQNYVYAIALPGDANAEFYGSTSSLLAGAQAANAPSGSTGTWAVSLPDGSYATGVGFAPGTDAAAAAQADSSALKAGDTDTAKSDAAKWTDYWNDVFSRVPAAEDYSVHATEAVGVTAEQVKLQYYRAWWNLQANVLPATPETGNTKAQVATGKASLWLNGSPGTRDEASWDSLLGMRYLVHIDPEDAWQAFEGMMSEVQPDGMLGGESLPSLKAQTAWALYQATGDKKRLAGVYDALVSNLNWAEQNPRWILGSYDHPDEKDAEFVVSLLVDLGYAQQISATLGHTADVEHWKQMSSDLLTDYETWFFPAPGVTLYKHYVDGSHPDDPGDGLSMYVLTGLHTPGIDQAALTELKNRFNAEYNLNKQFAGLAPQAIKAPDAMFIEYGLLDQGMTDEAAAFNNVMMRDIVRSGWFSEVYEQSSDSLDGVPDASGVRPSLFGITNLIDTVWVNNGYRSDQGSMSFVRLGDWKGGVSGLSLDGKKVDVETSPSAALVRDASGTITFSGSAVADRVACRTLDAPVGVTVTLPASCLASADPGNGGDPGDGGNPGNGGTPGDGSGPGSGAGTGTGASVGGDAGTSSTDAALASTGSDIAASVAIAVIVLLAGAGVLVIRRRRKRAE